MHCSCIDVLHLKPSSDGWTLLVGAHRYVQFLDVFVAGIALGLLRMPIKHKLFS